MDADIKNAFKRIERILKDVVTKDDLESFARKDDLKGFAKKDDLEEATSKLATKEELQETISKLATKKELQDALANVVSNDTALSCFVLKPDFEEFRDYVVDNMFTKKEFFEWVATFDDVLEEMRDMRQNRILSEGAFMHLDDAVAQHERRIRALEDKSNAR